MLLTSKFERKKPKWPRNSPSYEHEKKWQNILILCDLGAETHISGVIYCSSSDL